MTESASDPQQQWTIVVRRSVGIPDLVAEDDARGALIEYLEDQLHEHGWRTPTRAIAEPIVDALIALGASLDPEDAMFSAEAFVSDSAFATQAAAQRLVSRGMSVVDPEHLVFDTMTEYPPEVIAAAQEVLDRIRQYVRELPLES